MEKFESISSINSKEQSSNSENSSKQTKEILNSDTAKSILPYLTLNLISEEEQANILELVESLDFSSSHRGRPSYSFLIEHRIADLAGEGKKYEEDRIITKKHSEARKLFCAAILDKYNNSDNDGKWAIYENFFSFSPSFSSYCGGLESSLELLSIAERSNKNDCARDIYDEVVYDYSFSDSNPFKEILTSKNISPLKQLQLLTVINSISNHCGEDGWSAKALKKIEEAFTSLSENKNSTPLIQIISESYSQEIRDRFNTKWVEIDEDDPKYDEYFIEYELKKREIKSEQEQLHHDFPALPENRFLTIIAPGIAATATENDRIDNFSNKTGRKTASPLNYSAKNTFGLTQEELFLISSAHSPTTKQLLDKQLNLNLSEIPIESQAHLLKFMTKANNDRFGKLTAVLKNTKNENLRKKLLENFVAVDFGEDFGDSLLSITSSEKITDEEKLKIFKSLGSCRKSIKSVANLFRGVDDRRFTKQLSRAANERLTDIITVFKEIGEKGSVSANLEQFGEAHFNLKNAMEALEYERKSLRIISGTLCDAQKGEEGAFAEEVIGPSYNRNSHIFNFYSKDYGHVLLYVRPEGSESFKSTYEYGNKTGIEASISFIVNPISPLQLPSPFRPHKDALKNPHFYDESTMDKVSAIRLDREGRTKNMAANDPKRSPINKSGSISVDLAAIGDRADTPSGKIARLISVGNKLRQKNAQLNHNTNWFDQEYGNEDQFRRIANVAILYAKGVSESHPPSRNQESFTNLLRAKTGKKALVLTSAAPKENPAA
ncbi:hypothetical protein IKG45_02100 [Candidatus Saccharibacteria bacterium]|nr:hypothetical protein [Candidatus Saccharibacteria bacterium]